MSPPSSSLLPWLMLYASLPPFSAMMMQIAVGANISGANYNPAVSVALLLRDFQKSKVLPTVGYIISQTLGAIAGECSYLPEPPPLAPAYWRGPGS